MFHYHILWASSQSLCLAFHQIIQGIAGSQILNSQTQTDPFIYSATSAIFASRSERAIVSIEL